MALDGIIISKVKENLVSHLPIRINKISESSKTEIIFNIHSNNIRTNLVMSFHANDNHIALSNKSYTDFKEPSTFVMVLRKYLINGIITSIEQIDYDRYLLLHVRALDDLYDEKEYILSVELMGKYANLVLVDKASYKIIDAYKKIPPYENTKRTILVGATFELIESQNKQDPFTIDGVNLDESLVKQLQGFSKLLEDEVRYRINNKQTFKDIMKEIKDSNHLYISNNNFHVIALTHLNIEPIQKEINDGFDYLFYQKSQQERIKSVTDDISKFIKRELKHYNNKLIKLESSLEDALNLDDDKENGDMLYYYPNLEEKGLKEIEIEDYEGNKKLIKLDPKLSIKQNANKYYQIYGKKRKGKVYIEEQINICQNEIDYFEGLQEQLTIASYQDGLEIKEELVKYGYIKKKINQKKKKKINLYQVEYNGYLITWGKNNIQNDFLTFDYAKANHTYFHASKYHGSHVVVNGSNLDETVIRKAANIAAYNSKGRYSSSVPVDYCLVKDVKKVKGAKLGFVTIRNQKTIYIDPEEIDLDIKQI